MQAIQTKYLPATNTRPTRIKAFCARGAIVITNDDSRESAHCYAANKLCEKFVADDVKLYGTPPLQNPWARKRISGCLPNGNYAHVFTS